MLVKDLFTFFDSFDDYTEFMCFKSKDDYLRNGSYFVCLHKYYLLDLYGDFEICKVFVYRFTNRVDLLFNDT